VDNRRKFLSQEYLKQKVMTANPAELIVILVESCIKNLKLAEIYYTEQKSIDKTNSCLIKSQDIIIELINCLDMNISLSSQLLEIYNFLLSSIRKINIKKDFSKMQDLLDILNSMRDTWEQIATLPSASPAASTPSFVSEVG
jgi:flagellar protein FliS